MKILITGSNGQLGSELKELAIDYPQWEFLFTDEKELDITKEDKIQELFASFQPEVVINCAAYTAVDKAEEESSLAYKLNSEAVALLAKASTQHEAMFVHVSTDYVFDGKTWSPYTEQDSINPLSVYGKSKASGEQYVQQICKKAIIIRTAWLYSSFGNNFVKTILRYAREKGKLNIVFDQTGTPTYARDLAKTILQIIPAAIKNISVEIYHFSNEGVISWYDFAKAIVEEANVECQIFPITSAEYPQKAIRPFFSVLNKNKIKKTYAIEIPYWRDSLKECLQKVPELKGSPLSELH
jgi:dTDP-4-dehydrorhamnose reductase